MSKDQLSRIVIRSNVPMTFFSAEFFDNALKWWTLQRTFTPKLNINDRHGAAREDSYWESVRSRRGTILCGKWSPDRGDSDDDDDDEWDMDEEYIFYLEIDTPIRRTVLWICHRKCTSIHYAEHTRHSWIEERERVSSRVDRLQNTADIWSFCPSVCRIRWKPGLII